jgi:penicillin amidase
LLFIAYFRLLSRCFGIVYIKPKYEVRCALRSKETTVYFDDFGIPHIYMQQTIDAMTALGYVHAQDRLWQMELMRRIAPGRLSEILVLWH